MWKKIWLRVTSERGQALLEFAFVFPIMLVFLLMLVDFGIALDRREVIQHAVREAARQGAVGASTATVVDIAVDQSQGIFEDSDITVCYVEGPGGSSDAGTAGSYIRVTGSFTYEFSVGKEFLGLFSVAAPGIPMEPSAAARLEQDVAGATAC